MPVDDQDNANNLGHARKRRRMEDKIRKPGGKRPRRCDKDPKQTNTSSYFSLNQSSTGNLPQNYQNNISSQTAAATSSSSIIPTITNVTNVHSTSSSNACNASSTSNVVRAIRILTPLNVNIPLSQQQGQPVNQYIVVKPNPAH